MNRTTTLSIVMVGALAVAGCGSGDDEVVSTTTDVIVDADASAAATTIAAAEPTPTASPATSAAPPETSAPEPPPPATTVEPAEPVGDFCDELRAFLAEWVNDEIGPADLTARYASLGAIAPDELVESFRILEEGNAILVETRDIGQLPDEAAYNAAGEQVAGYAADVCGIALEEL